MTASTLLPRAQSALQLASQGKLDLSELFQIAQQLTEGGQAPQAAGLYRAWLQGSPASPLAYAACFNLAVTLSGMGDDAGAEAVYREAMARNPQFVEARLNLGTLLERLGRPDEALATWQDILVQVAGLSPAFQLQTLNNLGRLLEIQKRLPEAQAILTRSLALDPSQPNVLTHWVHLRQKLCEWPVYSELPRVSQRAMLDGTSALAMLSASPDPAEQLAAARRFIKEKVKTAVPELYQGEGYAHERLRIGYLSSDFCSHAVSILTAELYELHDRNRVEVYAFSWSREDGSPLRARVVNAMDHYIRIDGMSDEQAARCILDHEIDILVDLHGLTLGARPGILCYRPAPVQATWLGLPGPTAIPNVDYVLSDPFVLPPELEPHFTERPLHLPHCFQINDRRRVIGARPTRAANNLPDDAFVFCAFNNAFKITPDVFGAWMRILQQVPDSVLWLVSDIVETRANLLREAAAHGIGAERLHFAGRALPADYLARYQVADLFLDTAPFNGGTTASDALWAGLPVLTWSGRTFSSRMAGSLLHAVNLPELVTHSLEDYERQAVALAKDRPQLAALRQRLAEGRDASHLFDTPRFVRGLEDVFERAAKRAPGAPPLGARAPETETEAVALPDPARLPAVPAATMQQEALLSMVPEGATRLVELGGASMAGLWRSRHPATRFTAVSHDAGRAAGAPWCSEVVALDPEQLPLGRLRELARDAVWLMPGTLEQLKDPWALLRKLRMETPGALEVVACIGNAQYWEQQASLAAGTLHYKDGGLLPRRQLRWLSRASLAELFLANGYALVDVRAISLQPPPPAVLQAIRQLASAANADPELAVQDASAYQYLVRARAA